jgi:hypothetical protein
MIFVVMVIIMALSGVKVDDSKVEVKEASRGDQILSVYSMVTATGFAQMIFPIYNKLKVRTNHYMSVSILTACLLCTFLYSTFAVACGQIFGETLTSGEAKFNVMANINVMYLNDSRTSILYLSLVLRIIFTLLLIFHIPFIFFVAKEGFLIMVDELSRNTISKHLNLVEEEEASILENREDEYKGYSDMNDWHYYTSVSLLILVQTLGAIKFKYIFQVMPLVSSVAINCLDFLFPAIFYLRACHLYGGATKVLQLAACICMMMSFVIISSNLF